MNHAAGLDYTPVSTQLTFSAGDGPGTSLPGALNPTDDINVEGNENVQLNGVVSAGSGTFVPGGDSATLVIQDDDRKISNFVYHKH